MIEHLTGAILYKDDERVVIDAGGVGYGVEVPSNTMARLGAPGETARLWIKTWVSESDIALYGFSTRGEREVFEVFTGVSGVGPRLGLAILSTYSIEELVQIVMRADAERLKRVPGIGLKKAEKILVEMKDRVDRLSVGIEPERRAALAAGSPVASAGEPALPSGTARDAAAALEALDLHPAVARRAVARALEELGPDAGLESLVREALRHRHAV